MKVILKQEVDKLGLAGDVVDVADGYGRNYLLPRGLAILATKNAMKQAETLTRSRKAREAATIDDAQEQKQAIEARTYRIEARVDDAGHLYGSVRVDDVHRVIKDRGHEIEKRRIDLRSPIKMIGTYEVDVRVHPQVTATIQVEVVDEEGNVTVDASGRIVGADEPETVAPSIEEAALEAAAEIEESDEGETALDPNAIDPDQPTAIADAQQPVPTEPEPDVEIPDTPDEQTAEA